MKKVLKTLLLVGLGVTYFCNLFFMFTYRPLEILIANMIVWALIFVIPGIIKFIDCLNELDCSSCSFYRNKNSIRNNPFYEYSYIDKEKFVKEKKKRLIQDSQVLK